MSSELINSGWVIGSKLLGDPGVSSWQALSPLMAALPPPPRPAGAGCTTNTNASIGTYMRVAYVFKQPSEYHIAVPRATVVQVTLHTTTNRSWYNNNHQQVVVDVWMCWAGVCCVHQVLSQAHRGLQLVWFVRTPPLAIASSHVVVRHS